MELISNYKEYARLLEMVFGDSNRHIAEHCIAVAEQVDCFCVKMNVHPIIQDRAIKLALVHDLGKVKWLQDRSLDDYNATMEVLSSIPSSILPKDIEYITYLLRYLNYGILNSASIMSFPVEVSMVAFSDLHVIEASPVTIDKRRDYLKSKYFVDRSQEEFDSFWNLRMNFVNKFNDYFNNIEIPKDKNSIISLSLFTGGWLYKGEYALLEKAANLAVQTGRDYIEVGSWRGKSTLLIASALVGTDMCLQCIDNWQGGTDTDCNRLAKSFDMKKEFANNTAIFKNHINPIVGLSTDEKVIKQLPQSIGFVFFDGAHDYDTVIKEIDIYFPLLTDGGIICFHDTDNPKYPGVRKAIEEKVAPQTSFIGQASYLTVYQKNKVL